MFLHSLALLKCSWLEGTYFLGILHRGKFLSKTFLELSKASIVMLSMGLFLQREAFTAGIQWNSESIESDYFIYIGNRVAFIHRHIVLRRRKKADTSQPGQRQSKLSAWHETTGPNSQNVLLFFVIRLSQSGIVQLCLLRECGRAAALC